MMGISQKREIPTLYKTTLKAWYKKNKASLERGNKNLGKVHFFADEVINYNDVTIGITALKLLTKLGYDVEIAPLKESARPAMSKGLLDHAKKVAEENVSYRERLIERRRSA